MIKGFIAQLDEFLLNNPNCDADEREVLIELAQTFTVEEG